MREQDQDLQSPLAEKPSLLLVLCLGTILLVFGHWLYEGFRGGKASQIWPKIEGAIIEARMEEFIDASGAEYRAHIVYEYEVNGVRYTNETVRFGTFIANANPKLIEQYLQRYPIGKKVKVYYNPDIPSEATLRIGVAVQIYLGIAIGAVIGLYFLRETMRFASRRKNAL